MSTATIEALLAFKQAAGLHLCQEIIWHNPARLPSPAQWVTVERSRLKDSFTRIWWLSTTETPKADNRRVLHPYSASMKRLLEKKKYNAGKRPSEHVISEESFLTDNGGAIAPSMLNNELLDSVLYMSNTAVDHSYRDYCRDHVLKQHPARMPENLARFFISFLTEGNDLVFDPFAGSNTTGSVAERLGRRWFSIEMSEEYVKGSIARFSASNVTNT
jgi:site-specific DNA-methyltransferase (cytosine-N4-specific)